MKIVIIAEQFRRKVPGGIGTYIRGLLKGLHETPAALVGLWASRGPSKADPLDIYGYEVIKSQLPSLLFTRACDFGLIKPPRLAVTNTWEIVHATSLLTPRSKNAPVTVMVHDLAWRSFPEAFPPRGRAWHEAALRRSLQRCTHFITPGTTTADLLIKEGLDHKRISVIEEGCDLTEDIDIDGMNQLLNENGINSPFILSVGTLEPRKNLDRLIEAYGKIRNKLPEKLPLLIAGPRGWGKTIIPTEGVHIVGTLSPSVLNALYKSCKLFVYVPLLEGFGLPVVEAMRMGAPVVASDVPSSGGAVYEVSPIDIDSIAEGIFQVLSNDDLHNDLIERGYKRTTELTWQRCAQQHVELWESLL